jgi:hypothetical protein
LGGDEPVQGCALREIVVFLFDAGRRTGGGEVSYEHALILR